MDYYGGAGSAPRHTYGTRVGTNEPWTHTPLGGSPFLTDGL